MIQTLCLTTNWKQLLSWCVITFRTWLEFSVFCPKKTRTNLFMRSFSSLVYLYRSYRSLQVKAAAPYPESEPKVVKHTIVVHHDSFLLKYTNLWDSLSYLCLFVSPPHALIIHWARTCAAQYLQNHQRSYNNSWRHFALWDLYSEFLWKSINCLLPDVYSSLRAVGALELVPSVTDLVHCHANKTEWCFFGGFNCKKSDTNTLYLLWGQLLCGKV